MYWFLNSFDTKVRKKILLPDGLKCFYASLLMMICAFPATYVVAQDDTHPVHSHALALYGEPALALGFGHFPYANPDAPKGGQFVQGLSGTFDTLNPYVAPGSPAQGINGQVIETLMIRNYNEPFTLYGLLAETVATPDDRSFVEFRLNPRAHFSDGHPVMAEDIVFSWELLRDRGRPNYRTYYAKVKKAEIRDDYTVRFDLSGVNDRELPLILGLMPIFPKHATPTDHFASTGFVPLLGSGPYVVENVQAGQSITLRRDRSYWGSDLPTRRGTGNFDELRYDYYRDSNTLFEAFKKGLYDYREEQDPALWAQEYDFAAVKNSAVIRENFERKLPAGMNGLAFNMRRSFFRDVRVREALILLLDFEWMNATLYHGLYARTGSYFDQSDLSSSGRPADQAERDLLALYKGSVRTNIMDGIWKPPVSDGSGRDRSKIAQALHLLDQAGWALKDGHLARKSDGQPFVFEVLVKTREQERLSLSYARQLAAAGIQASVRFVDALQFERRMQVYDFDMAPYFWFATLSPGNEQAFYWGSNAAKTDGTRNYMGIQSAAVDAMITKIGEARRRAELVSAVRALDRVLLSGFYVVPLYHAPAYWTARRSSIRHPEHISTHGPLVETFWRAHSE
jgi:peptide/nickel transport system substrate-binding protein